MGENVAITDFMIFGDDCNGFTTSEIAQMVYFLRDGDKRSVACYVHNDVSKFPVTITILQHLNDTSCSLSPHTGKVPAQPGIGVSLSRPSSSNSTENRNTFIAYLRSIGLVLLLFMFLVTLSMLMDRVGCYNVREKKLIVRKLTSTVNSYGIATFSVRGEGQRF